MREYLEADHVDCLWWLDTLAMLSDGITNGSVEREAMIKACQLGIWQIVCLRPAFKQLRS